MCANTDTHLFGCAGDKALVQPESLFLRETLSLVVPKQGTLDLSHTHTQKNKQGGERSEDDRCLQSAVRMRQETSPFAW